METNAKNSTLTRNSYQTHLKNQVVELSILPSTDGLDPTSVDFIAGTVGGKL